MSQIALFGLSAVLAALALFVWRARPESLVNRWFAAQTTFLASWVFGVGGLQGGTHLDSWGRFTFASASLIPAAFLGFTRCYPTPTTRPSRRALSVIFIIGTSLALLSLTTSLIVSGNELTPAGLVRIPGLFYPAFVVYFIATWAVALAVFISKWSQARGLPRAQLQYLGAGILISAAGGIGLNLVLPLLTGRSTHSWLGPYFSFVFVALIAHAIIRHRLMDLRLAINRGLSYVIAMGLTSAVLIIFAHSTVADWKSQAVLIHPDLLLVALVALGVLSTPAKRLFNYVVDTYLYRGRTDHASALREATRRLGHLMQPTELATQLQAVLTNAFVPESFTMLVRPFESATLERLSPSTSTQLDWSDLSTLLTENPSPGVLVLNPAHETGSALHAHEALRLAGLEVVVTLARRNQLLGVILLGPRRSGDAYFKDDLAFIESLAELASIALENALLYRQRIQMFEYSERLLESLDSAVVAVDVFGRITSFNPAAVKLLGLPQDSRGVLLDVVPSEVGWALALALRSTWCPREVEFAIEHPGGTFHAILSTAVLHEDEGRVSGALAVITDLSTIKALERNQRRIEHFAVMARFYAGIAHEIRNPLAAISNFISMLPDRFDDPEYRDTAVRLLPIEVSRIVRLADRLRLMAPSEGGKLTTVSLLPLLNDIITIHSPAAQEQRIKIELQCPDELPPILGDPGQLVQLFVNLIKNAIEAMPEGGTVAVEADRSATAAIVVRVIDEGSGIEPTARPKVFEPFFTTKPTGTGLGLAICREIADFHRARLALYPRGAIDGTVAEIEFPALVSASS